MRRPAFGIGVLLTAGTAFGLFWFHSRSEPRPSILLITIDSLSRDHLGVYGYDRDTTPRLDALARAGVVFDRAYTQATLSAPAHATLLTSLPTLTTGVLNNGFRLAADQLTVAEVLLAAGYDTAAFVGHPFVGPEFGFAQGFAVAELHPVASHAPGHCGHPDRDPGDDPEAGFDALIRWLGRPRSAPTFAWLHVQHVHGGYEPLPPYDRRFGTPPPSREDLFCLDTLDRHDGGEIVLTPAERDYIVALYDGEIAWVDAQIGRVLDALAASGQAERTIVAVTADHGETLFDDAAFRRYGHGPYRTETELRIPLILAGPIPGRGGSRVEEMVGLIDLAPTLLELAAIARPRAWRGVSLEPLLVGQLVTSPEAGLSCTMQTDGTTRYAVSEERYKLLIDSNAGGEELRLFDRETDPGEEHDRSTDPILAPVLHRLTQRLTAWYGAASSAQARRESKPDPRVLELLRRGGYIVVDQATRLSPPAAASGAASRP